MNLSSTRGITLVLVAALLAAGCAGKSDHNVAPPNSTPASSSAAANGSVTGDIGGMRVVATPGGGSDDLRLSEGSVPAGQPFEAAVASSTPVRITLASGGQPSKPITLRFDLSGDQALADTFSDTVKPVVRSVSDTDPQHTDLLAASWDPASKTVTATSEHLSVFQVIAADVGKVGDAIGRAWKQFAVGQADSPCGDKSEITIAGTKLVLTPSKVGPVAACLSDGGDGAVGVDFINGTLQYYDVISDPAGSFTFTGTLGSDDVIATWLHESSRSPAGLLTPKGNGKLVLPAGTTSAKIHVDVNPAMLQMKTLLTGLGMLGVDYEAELRALMATKDGWDCIVTATKVAKPPVSGDVEGFRDTLGGISQCGLSASKLAVGDRKYILHRLGIATSMVTTLPDQLLANVTGVVGELDGNNHLTFTLTAASNSIPTTPTPTTGAILNLSTVSLDAGGGLMIGPNHFKFTPKSRDKQGLYVDLSYQWTINRPPGSNLGYCKEHVTVTDTNGAVIAEFRDDQDFNACHGGGGWNSLIKIRQPGTYNVTADIDMQHGPPLHAVQQFTVDP